MRNRRALPPLQLPPLTLNGFLQPHRNNLPRRQISKKRTQVIQPPSPLSSASSTPATKFTSEQSQNLSASSWAQDSCLQEVNRNSGIFVAFSQEEFQAQNTPGEFSTIFCGHDSSLRSSPSSSCPDCSSVDKTCVSSDKHFLCNQKTCTTPSSVATCVQTTIQPDFSDFAAVVHMYHHGACGHAKLPSTPKPIHEILISIHDRDDGTPNLTLEQFSRARVFFHPFIRPPPPSKPTSDRPHPRHGTASTKPASSHLHSKVLILAPRSLAADALSLAAGLVCYSGLSVARSEGGQEDTEIDIAAAGDIDGPLKDEDRATAVHALFMRLHDFEHDDGLGLRDEWRGAISRSGMDVIGDWLGSC